MMQIRLVRVDGDPEAVKPLIESEEWNEESTPRNIIYEWTVNAIE